MWEQYAPDPRMKLNLGIRRRLAPLLDNDRRKIELINSLLFTFPGSPILYYGDEIGMGDNLDLPDRNGVRTPMQWDDTPNAGFTEGRPFSEFVKGDLDYRQLNVKTQLVDQNSLFHGIKKMIGVRRQHPAFGRGGMRWVDSSNAAIAGYQRQYQRERILVLNNLSDSQQTIVLTPEDQGVAVNLFTENDQLLNSSLTLQPYGYLWLKYNRG
jgi:maltose alpha-D-glucosyltransferase/alpha-amylase